jgi:hypothetical protein
MFSPLADIRYSINRTDFMKSHGKPPPFAPRGAAVLSNGTAVEIDYTDSVKARQLVGGLPVDQLIGVGWRDRFTGEWKVTVRGTVVEKHTGAGATTLSEAVANALVAASDAEAAENSLRADPVAHLERELARHDWWAMMSDSYAVTLAGQRHMDEIRGIVAQCPVDVVRNLWAKYAPAEFDCPV